MKFFREMFMKVRVVLTVALIAAGTALLDVLASFDWTDALGPWAAPISLLVAWFLAWWKKETVGYDGTASTTSKSKDA